LDFIPMAKERYFLLCNLKTLDRAETSELLALIRSKEFLDIVARLPGYSAPRVGQVVRLDKEFPALAVQ
jgi:putative molybdopterin biosynthesis protein